MSRRQTIELLAEKVLIEDLFRTEFLIMNRLHKISMLAILAGLCSPAFASQDAPTPPVDQAVPSANAPLPSAAQQAPVSPAQIVDREFPSYDVDKSGQLDATEFAAWVAKLRPPAPSGAPAAEAQSSANLFARADADHNQLVSKTEMTTLLTTARG